MNDTLFAVEPQLAVTEFIELLTQSTLAERRPMNEPDTLAKMLANADVIVTARVDGLLVGVSRAISDFSYCTYLSDLAVHEAYQRRGIGRELVRRTHEAAGLNTAPVLLAAPAAETYYGRVGMKLHPSAWVVRRVPAQQKPPAQPGANG